MVAVVVKRYREVEMYRKRKKQVEGRRIMNQSSTRGKLSCVCDDIVTSSDLSMVLTHAVAKNRNRIVRFIALCSVKGLYSINIRRMGIK